MSRATRVCACVIFLVLVVVWFPRPALAYEADVHFVLTYVLARLAGLPDADSWLIARADQSQDDNATTTAFRFPLPPPHYQQHGMNWHAFGADQHAVMKRFQELQCRAGVRQTMNRGIETNCAQPVPAPYPLQLVRLGQFLHFYEDTYAHSRANDTTAQWVPYGALFGHFFQGIQPDLVPNRPQLAHLMAEDVFAALASFAEDHGDKPFVRPSTEQLDATVDAIASGYRNPHRSADLNDVRCALGRYFSRTGLWPGEPGIERVAYQSLTYDEDGMPRPIPDKLEPSALGPAACENAAP